MNTAPRIMKTFTFQSHRDQILRGFATTYVHRQLISIWEKSLQSLKPQNPNSLTIYLCDDLQLQRVHLIIGQSRGSQDDPARFACNGEL